MSTEFHDSLYGRIAIPDWVRPFLKIPEFVRLRDVRLSNVDSFQFKDFSGPSRWEHCVSVAWLSLRCATKRKLSNLETVHLTLAGLLHDVATPPFAHTAEYVIDGFDHERESENLLSYEKSSNFVGGIPVFASEFPRFAQTCKRVSAELGVVIDPTEVSRLIVGRGDNGFLIHGTLDLDNADNVVRACRSMGIDVDTRIPCEIADWLAVQDSPPIDLANVTEPAVAKWRSYRSLLYNTFFRSSDAELGRQAFLQHLMRRALEDGMSERSLIWNTDSGFLNDAALISSKTKRRSTLAELVNRYKLLDEPHKIAHIDIDSAQELSRLSQPRVVQWIERKLTAKQFDPFVSVFKVRTSESPLQGNLFPPSLGALLVFKLGGRTQLDHLPSFLSKQMNLAIANDSTIGSQALSNVLARQVADWLKSEPWNQTTPIRITSIQNRLGAVGNWGFRLSRNDALHPYPGTFVHAIPSTLISCLGLGGGLMVDPFGGTGQTAVEAIKQGSRAVSADCNTIATGAAKAKLTFLDSRARLRIRKIDRDALLQDRDVISLPEFDLREKWFHNRTLRELALISSWIDYRRDENVKQFLRAAFNAILTNCTGRRGKEHSYFADNTPLKKGVSTPPYQDAAKEFLERVARNLRTVEDFYAQIERSGRRVDETLNLASVLRVDLNSAQPCDYGVDANTVDAIVTSPPYLCMADYSLGQRLAYYFSCPDQLSADFRSEIGTRRGRNNPKRAVAEYVASLRCFAELSAKLVKPGGYVACVLGTPTSKAFVSHEFTQELDGALEGQGFKMAWSIQRPISWHRNHGYARLKEERISVHVNAKA